MGEIKTKSEHKLMIVVHGTGTVELAIKGKGDLTTFDLISKKTSSS